MKVTRSLLSGVVVLGLLVAMFTVVLTGTSIAATTVLGTCTVITPSSSTVISAPGFYCLNANSNISLSSGRAITINASNVVLDLNGYTMTNTNGSNTADGITTTASPANVTIRNGKIVGYMRGISFQTGSKYVVENMTVDSAAETGIDVEASNSIVRNNIVRGARSLIVVCGSDVRVLDNDVVNTSMDNGNLSGIDSCLGSTPRLIVEGNRIANLGVNNGNGIYLDDALVINNRIINWAIGVNGNQGSCKYRDNMFMNVGVESNGCLSVGNNNN